MPFRRRPRYGIHMMAFHPTADLRDHSLSIQGDRKRACRGELSPTTASTLPPPSTRGTSNNTDEDPSHRRTLRLTASTPN